MVRSREVDFSTFDEHAGATIYVPTATLPDGVELIAAQANLLRSGTSLNTELEKTCGATFICYSDSDIRKAAVVCNNFEVGEKTAAWFEAVQTRGIPLDGFKIPKVMKSTTTEDGLGVKRDFATESDNATRTGTK